MPASQALKPLRELAVDIVKEQDIVLAFQRRKRKLFRLVGPCGYIGTIKGVICPGTNCRKWNVLAAYRNGEWA